MKDVYNQMNFAVGKRKGKGLNVKYQNNRNQW